MPCLQPEMSVTCSTTGRPDHPLYSRSWQRGRLVRVWELQYIVCVGSQSLHNITCDVCIDYEVEVVCYMYVCRVLYGYLYV